MADLEQPQQKMVMPSTEERKTEEMKDVSEEKRPLMVPLAEDKTHDSNSLSVAENKKEPEIIKRHSEGGSVNRDIALAEVEKEKKMSFIRAWEDSKKSNAENKFHKNLAEVTSWENSSRAVVEAKLRKKEEQLEKKKEAYAELMKNNIALIHKQAEEKRAMIEAKRGEELLQAEESAAKFRAIGSIPTKFLGCFGG